MRRGPRAAHQGSNRGWQPQQTFGVQAAQQGPGSNQFPSLPGLVVPQMPQMPTPPPGLPPFDPSNPLAALLAIQALGLPSLLGNMPGVSLPNPTNKGSVNVNWSGKGKRPGERCRDYDFKGFCTRGNNCPFEHGSEAVTVGQNEPYDPNNSTILASLTPPNGDGRHHGLERNRRGKGRGGRSRSRAPFSFGGSNYDRNITTIVVEQIPEENFDEKQVYDFFQQFGDIEEVTLQPYKHLALVRYKDHSSAKTAFQSPKTIFENRFVKVYWYKPDARKSSREMNGHGPRSEAGTTDVKMEDEFKIDMEEFTQRQEAAQKVYEEKQKLLAEAETKRRELGEQLRTQAEERRKLLEKLAVKTREKAAAINAVNGTSASTADKKAAATDALKAKLAELEAEAEAIGLKAEQENSTWPSFGRGQGGLRGRGGFVPRGRGYDPSFSQRKAYRGFRGGFRGGRGGFLPPRGGAVKRLDNRPKRVMVTGVEPGSDKDEQLRSLLFVSRTFNVQIASKHS